MTDPLFPQYRCFGRSAKDEHSCHGGEYASCVAHAPRRNVKRIFHALLILGLLFAPAISTQSQASQPSGQASTPKSETVYITRTGKKYHKIGCRYLNRSKIAIKRNEALANGYSACKICGG